MVNIGHLFVPGPVPVTTLSYLIKRNHIKLADKDSRDSGHFCECATPQSELVEMTSTNFRTSLSVRDVKCVRGGRCPNMCGICPSCVFAPEPPGSTHCVWTLSDDFKRRFVLELILRCRDVQVLQEILSALGLVLWNLFTYSRSEGPASRHHPLSSERGLDGTPLGADVSEIWDWFSDSPDLVKTGYLLRIFLRCDAEFLCVVVNLTSVLLARLKRGLLQFEVSDPCDTQLVQCIAEDSEEPTLTIVPGSSKSMSGVSRYRDFIGCLPINLSKRILGLLDEHALRICQKVSRYWQHVAHDTLDEIKFRRNFQEQMDAMLMKYRGIDIVSHTYANFMEVPVPIGDDDDMDKDLGTPEFELFETPDANVETMTVQMEERNVYCSPYFTKVVYDVEDPHRMLDYRGGSLMAVGSKDRAVHLLSLGSETKVLRVMKGHVGIIREVLLCEDRDLAITASSDASIRCWNLKTDRCVMALYGHTGSVNCLALHGDRLVSGSKDRLVKVWNLQTGRDLKEYHFKHPSAVKCVKTNETRVFSSCDHGLIKVWDMEKASLIRVITAHKMSVRCLFLDEWHFLSGDCDGQVMAWSVKSDAKHCLKTFDHAKEVLSLTLVYLRVVTGSVDGKIRVFNFLTGDCLRVITVETESHRILSVHFNDSSIIANTVFCIKHLQFSKVFWDYTSRGDASEKSPSSVGELPSNSAEGDHTENSVSPSQNSDRRPIRQANFLSASAKHRAPELLLKPSVTQSQKAKSEQIKRKGPHHPPTRDSLIRVDASQKPQCTEEDNVNMRSSARVQDSSGSRAPRGPGEKRPHTHGGPRQDTREVQPSRAKTCGPVGPRRAPTHSADTLKATKRVAGFTSGAAEGEGRPMRGLNHPESCTKSGSSFPRISPDGEPTGPRRLTATRLEGCGCQEGTHTELPAKSIQEGQRKRKSRVHK